MSLIRKYIDLINKQMTNESLAEDGVSPADHAEIASLTAYIDEYGRMAKPDEKATWKLAHASDRLRQLAKKYRFDPIADSINNVLTKSKPMAKVDPQRKSWYTN